MGLSDRARGVLLDLDGTLFDTAPDLIGSLNRLRGEHGLPPLPRIWPTQWAMAAFR